MRPGTAIFAAMNISSFRTAPRSAYAFLIAAIAAVTLAGAWFFQYGLGLEPCPLCLQQRYAYYAAIPLALGLGFLAKANPRSALVTYGLWLLAALLVFSALFGIYHAGVEWRWWAGPTTCAASTGSAAGGNLIEALKSARVVPCDEAPIRILGISLAGYNALISAGMALLVLKTLRQPLKEKR